ncbi:hypothetical protein D9615_002900 [Tricholomella constricta]|uniref:Diphthamide biosynthesis protein 4 n=1 Tax=Tricholomella constricta TaxID=117010 RepID=A0A8H5M672_9AGAR|nr:hypothetical protein D9615_002900 [Tricholomella constricta]
MAWKASFGHGVSSFKASRLDEALSHFTQASISHALKEQGGDQQHLIYDSRAAVYEKLGMPKEALRDAKAVITLAQDQWQGYARAARLFLLARKFDAALKMANMALDRVKPANAARRVDITNLRDDIHEAQRAEGRRKRASQNQFEKLPVELLGEVFRLVIWSDVAELIGLLRVCRHWRNVAWHTPSLWETLVLTSKSPARKLSLWIKQSKGRIRELHVKAGVASHIDWPFQELKDLPWDKLRVCNAVSWDVAGFLEKHGLVPHALSAIEALEMQEEQWSRRRASPSLFPLLQTAGVRSLSFIRSEFSWTELATHLTTLTTLHIFGCSKDPAGLVPTLMANPGLESLIIQDSILFTWPVDTAPVLLSHLKHLELQGSWASNLLELITTSALETCKIKGSRGSLDTALTVLNVAHNLSNLTHIAVDSSPVTPAILIRLLKHTPALTRLELLFLSKGANAVIEALAGTPMPPPPSKRTPTKTPAPASTDEERILCPALTHVNVSHSADIRTGPLVRLVRARLPPPTPAPHADTDPAAMTVDDSEREARKCARILGLTFDGCEQIDAEWLPWFRKQVPLTFRKLSPLNLILAASEFQPDFYELLSVPKDASAAEIKIAYHRALLRFHPDKNNHLNTPSKPESISISLIKDAYSILSEPSRRKQYDSSTRQRIAAVGPRPAQVVSLEEFEEVTHGSDPEEISTWQYECRCGGNYRIESSDMEKGHHLVGCSSCSEVVWVGYELQSDTGDDG